MRCPQCCTTQLQSCPECGVSICPGCDGKLCRGCDERQWNEIWNQADSIDYGDDDE